MERMESRMVKAKTDEVKMSEVLYQISLTLARIEGKVDVLAAQKGGASR